MDHDETLIQRQSELRIPHWRVVLEFDTQAPNVIGVDVKGPTIIGRNIESLGLTVDIDTGQFGTDAKGVSRRHAALIPDDEGVLLVDIGSTNGTYVNDELLEVGTRKRLGVDDVIRLSELTMRVRIIIRLRNSHSNAFTS